MLIAAAVLMFFRDHLGVLWAVLQLAALLYAMGPYDLFNLVDRYLKSLAAGDAAETERLAGILGSHAGLGAEQRPQAVMEGIFVGANRRLFALYFWFVLLGALGSLLVRGLAELRVVSTSRSLGFSHAAEQLYALMLWLPTRLFALGFALAGSLTHTFDRWSFAQTTHAEENDNLVKAAGLGVQAVVLGPAVVQRGLVLEGAGGEVEAPLPDVVGRVVAEKVTEGVTLMPPGCPR